MALVVVMAVAMSAARAVSAASRRVRSLARALWAAADSGAVPSARSLPYAAAKSLKNRGELPA